MLKSDLLTKRMQPNNQYCKILAYTPMTVKCILPQ